MNEKELNYGWMCILESSIGSVYEPDPKLREVYQNFLKYIFGEYEIVIENKKLYLKLSDTESLFYITNVPGEYPGNKKLEIYLYS